MVAMCAALTINVADFGAIPNSNQDSAPAIRKAIEACAERKATDLVFPAGTYNLANSSTLQLSPTAAPAGAYEPLRVSLDFDGLHNLAIHAEGAKLLAHGPQIPVYFANDDNVRLEGLSLDFADPPMAEGTVTESDSDSFDFKIDPALYRLSVKDGILYLDGEGWSSPIGFSQFVDPATCEVQFNTGDWAFSWKWPAKAEMVDSSTVRISAPQSVIPKVGNVVVLRAQERAQAAILINACLDAAFSRVTLNSSFGMGFVGRNSSNVTLDHCSVLPDPGRHFSLAADATHWIEMRGNVRIEGCVFRAQLDDAANVHGYYVPIQEVSGDTAIVSDRHFKSSPFCWGVPGDRVQFVDPATLLPLAEGVLATISYLDGGHFQARFTAPVSPLVGSGTLIENVSASPTFEYIHNDDRFHRARGVLIKTGGHVIIRNNLFRTPGAAILLGADTGRWDESGAVGDVEIRDNRFDHCNTSPYEGGSAVVSIDPDLPSALAKHPRFEKNVRIEENSFLTSDAPIFQSRSVDGLWFQANIIKVDAAPPPRLKGASWLNLDLCRNVVVSANSVDGKGDLPLVTTREMSPADVSSGER